MRRFTELYLELDATTRTGEKVEAMKRYFREAPAADAAWALHVLSGNRVIRAVPTRLLRAWIGEKTGYPLWLIDESYRAVGDLSETLALLLPERAVDEAPPLHELIEQSVLPLERMDDPSRRRVITGVWRRLSRQQVFLFHKLISGAMRVGVSRALVIRALAEVAGVAPAVMAHRLSGQWRPSAAAFGALLRGEGDTDGPGRPYPFYLASPLEGGGEALGPIDGWLAEWKWDGIRAQMIHRRGRVLVWSRGQEMVNASFPELVQAGRVLPDGTVLDGEVLAWEDGRPLGFAMLQRRIGRKRVEPRLWPEVPVVFMAYDVVEEGGRDVREEPLVRRRERLERLVEAARQADGEAALELSPLWQADSWADLHERMDEARQRGVEGLMLKRWDSTYGVGRQRGAWWKWKVEPFTVDAVLVAAQHGHGRRAGLFTDYTFAVWDRGELVTIAKAYSGLSNEQIREVDRFIRRHTTGRHGPVHTVEPRLVFELGFEQIQASDRHKSGVALRFPRMLRRRDDKGPADADTLDDLRRLLREQSQSTV